MRHLGVVVLSCSILLVCLGCGDESDDAALLKRMEQDILEFVGEPLCQDSTECRFIGLGVKPCGGPWKYVIYSMATVDSVELAARVAAYNDLNRELNQRHGWVSDCSVPPPPNLTCQDGRCVDAGYIP